MENTVVGGPIIRKIERADISAVANLMTHLSQIAVQSHPDIHRPLLVDHAREYLEEKIEAEQEFIYVAVADDQLVGYIHFEFCERAETIFSYARKNLYLHQIYVVKEFRRKGVGSQLISTMKQFAQEIENLKWIWFDMYTSNSSALKFYQSQGFEAIGTRMSLGQDSGFK
ncbi:GNAT family N-acetyltransferase [Acaryochloris sp. CCMEE 5410]|uniref:GNAT family N-acetyltransferase n=1 Tax=Acaryochloris sp. CCMEE 5410 TaxID=310037 RepID=UPI0002483938|nr:GNAT family N-acetyltransferase [Acaryochloris sp. CCMEE 5410]KAI9131334.1 GNAT family N-acetyltransferase [Acaryochloris sp. CCMEE 5410]